MISLSTVWLWGFSLYAIHDMVVHTSVWFWCFPTINTTHLSINWAGLANQIWSNGQNSTALLISPHIVTKYSLPIVRKNWIIRRRLGRKSVQAERVATGASDNTEGLGMVGVNGIVFIMEYSGPCIKLFTHDFWISSPKLHLIIVS